MKDIINTLEAVNSQLTSDRYNIKEEVKGYSLWIINRDTKEERVSYSIPFGANKATVMGFLMGVLHGHLDAGYFEK